MQGIHHAHNTRREKAFLAGAMVNINPDPVIDLLKVQCTKKSSSDNNPTSTNEAEPQVKSKEQPPAVHGIPSPPPLVSAQPVRLDSLELLSSDQASDTSSNIDILL